MDASAEAKAPAAGEVQVEKNPQACLMGLPAELRLRIFGFLFSGDWVKVEKMSVQRVSGEPGQAATATRAEDVVQDVTVPKDNSGRSEGHHASALHHNCSVLNKPTGKDDREAASQALICTCFGPAFPAILRSNKLIYNEAFPVFYGNLEVRVCLPPLDDVGRGPEVFNDLLKALPGAGLKYISKILLFQTTGRIGIAVNFDDEPGMGSFGPMWDKLSSEMPNIKHVRVHLDLDCRIWLSCFDFHQFVGLARLPNVRGVQVQYILGNKSLPPEEIIRDEDKTLEDFEKIMVSTIEKEVEKLEKRVEVSVIEVKSR